MSLMQQRDAEFARRREEARRKRESRDRPWRSSGTRSPSAASQRDRGAAGAGGTRSRRTSVRRKEQGPGAINEDTPPDLAKAILAGPLWS